MKNVLVAYQGLQLEGDVSIHVLQVPVIELQVNCCCIDIGMSQDLLQATEVNPTPHAIDGKTSRKVWG